MLTGVASEAYEIIIYGLFEKNVHCQVASIMAFMRVTATTIHVNLSLSAWAIFSGTYVCNNYIYNIYNDRPL